MSRKVPDGLAVAHDADAARALDDVERRRIVRRRRDVHGLVEAGRDLHEVVRAGRCGQAERSRRGGADDEEGLHGALERRIGMVRAEEPVQTMSTGPLLAAPPRPAPAARAPDRAAAAALIRARRCRGGRRSCRRPARSPPTSASRAASSSARTRSSQRRDTRRSAAAPRRSSPRSRARSPSARRVEPDVPDRGLRASTCGPTCRTSRSSRAPTWLAAGRPRCARAANTDLAYGEPFGSVRAPRRRSRRSSPGRAASSATPTGRGILAGSTQALLALGSVLARRAARTRIGVEDPGHRWRTRDARRVGPRGRSGSGRRRRPARRRLLARTSTPSSSARITASRSAWRSRRSAGVRSSSGRRRRRRAVVEHDYDAHFRYDRAPAACAAGAGARARRLRRHGERPACADDPPRLVAAAVAARRGHRGLHARANVVRAPPARRSSRSPSSSRRAISTASCAGPARRTRGAATSSPRRSLRARRRVACSCACRSRPTPTRHACSPL